MKGLTVSLSLFPERVPYLKYWIPMVRREGIDPEKLQLIVTDDMRDIVTLDDHIDDLREIFGSVKHLTYETPGGLLSPAMLRLNQAFREADHDFVLATHAECMLLGVLNRCFELAQPTLMVVFPTILSQESILESIEKEDFDSIPYPDILKLNGVERQPWVHSSIPCCWWWYATLVSRDNYLKIGGIDERLAEGWGADDDMISYLWQNQGWPIAVDTISWVVHLWHPDQNKGRPEAFEKNVKICREYSETDKKHCDQEFSARLVMERHWN